MIRRRLIAVVVVLILAVTLLLVFTVPRRQRTETAGPTGAPAEQNAATPQRRITATLFYVGLGGVALDPVQREVPFGDPVSEQARHIVEAQLTSPPTPYSSAIPQGTKVRAVYVTDRGDAFVDLTGEIVSKHTGGVLDELFAVYAIVNALTINLPAITRVQILVDGKEVDTLAGHVDLRQPLSKNTTWIRADGKS